MKNEFNQILYNVIDEILEFKGQRDFKQKYLSIEKGKKLLEPIPKKAKSISETLKEFNKDYLPYCTNDSSPTNMGFPDCGNNEGAIIGTLYSELLQQNLINQSGSSPSITFAEINVIRCIREIIGYDNPQKEEIKTISDIGGIVTLGGTMSNTVAMMLARENHVDNTMKKGVTNPQHFKVLIPENIAHYSIKSSLMWIGLGDSIVEVKTKNFKMDLEDLKFKLEKYNNDIMACVVYAGDSRSMTIDNLKEVYKIVKSVNKNIWCHVDACHGFSLAFSDKLKYKIDGIESYDSITIDAHKVLMIPYGLSMLITKKNSDFNKIKSESDLIMREDFAFGQITPFIGSKNAASLKLWFLIKTLGKEGIGKVIEKRHNMAKLLKQKLDNDPNFIVLNDVEINSVMFMMVENKYKNLDFDKINKYNKKI